MDFQTNRSILFSDTLVSDIFINEYMMSAEGDYVKVYLYCLFLGKHKKQIAYNDLSKKLGLDMTRIKQAFAYWENAGLLLKNESGMFICDIKEKEVHKIYRPKMTSTPEEAKNSSDKNKKRIQLITAINNTFFQGIMSPTWYIDIDVWFEKYGFEEDVMFSLFNYCYDRHALNKNYLVRVAENWHTRLIKTSCDLDSYFILYEKCNEIKKKISRKLGITRKLSEYEEAYVDKWVVDFGYEGNIIELALEKTTSKTNPSFDYINAILTQWHELGLKTVEQVKEYSKQFKQNQKDKKEKENTMPNKFVGQLKNVDMSKFYDNLNM